MDTYEEAKTMEEGWKRVEAAVQDALLIAFDGCHKIYVAMDKEQADWFRDNYEHTLEGSSDAMLDTLHEWYDESCPLVFISAVRSSPLNPNDGFRDLIPQGCGADEDEDEDY